MVVAEPTEEEDTLASSPLDSRVSCASAGASIDQFSLRVEALRSEQPYLEVEDLALLGCHGGEADDAGGGGDARGRRRREAERPGGTWRVSICKFFAGNEAEDAAGAQGAPFCPYFEQCKYAHSEAELRRPNPGSAAQAAAFGRGGAQATPQAAAARLAEVEALAAQRRHARVAVGRRPKVPAHVTLKRMNGLVMIGRPNP